MKKIFVLLMILGIFFLTGCGKNNEDSAFGKAALSGDDNSKIKLNVNLSFKQYVE